MEVDSHVDYPDILRRVAAGQDLEKDKWLGLRDHIFDRINNIAHNEFPIPALPLPRPLQQRIFSAITSSQTEPSSQEADKENAPSQPPADRSSVTEPQPKDASEGGAAAAAVQQLEPGQLPLQLESMLASIRSHLEAFTDYPPHTIQRVAELAHEPKAHYKALASYLHALDRVVQVTSGTNAYPLPPAVPDVSQLRVNGNAGFVSEHGRKDGDQEVPTSAGAGGTSSTWIHPHNAVGSDEALGGALLTPIPWLRQPSPDSTSNGSESTGADGSSGAAAQIHSEGSEAVDGPNGVGGVETVSVSVNGIPSTGHSRPVTQGELLRQEQEKGIVPVSQLSRSAESSPAVVSGPVGAIVVGSSGGVGGGGDGDEAMAAAEPEAEEGADEDEGEEAPREDREESPHARGPEEIGMSDTGPQAKTTSYIGEDGMNVQAIDVAAAVGRKPESDLEHAQDLESVDKAAASHNQETEGGPPSPSGESPGVKREAEDKLSGEAKKLKESEDVEPATDKETAQEGSDESKEAAGEPMDTDQSK